jgi:hypothetical protein
LIGLYTENLAKEGGFNDYSDGTFSHNMEWITYEAISFINETINDEKPFFLYFNPTVPHSSNDVKKAIEDFPCTNTSDPDFDWPDADDFPYIKGMVEDGNCTAYRETILERANQDEDLGKIWVDDAVGALMSALKDLGDDVFDNTIFLFQEDHGMETKGALYENGIRIPQFIHYPNEIKKNTKSEIPVSTIDIAATMMDFAGIDPPYELDGMSWKNVIGNSAKEDYWSNDRCLYFEVAEDRAVRCGCYKYLDIHKEGSDTYARGSSKGLANHLGGMLFDLCDGGDEYITDTNNNREENNITDSDIETELESTLGCYLDNTAPEEPAVYDVCFNQTSIPLPTDAPITCEDNPDYLHNGKDGRDCDWVGLKPGVRCDFNDLEPFYECPVTCNNTECETRSPTLAPTIICLDNPDYLHNGKDGRDCDWIGGRPGVRCDFNDLEPFYECPETCGNTECETRSPTSAPTIICLDNPDYLHNGKDGRDCDWVGGRPGVRCDFNDLEPFYECPVTCNNTECETRSPTSAPTIICLDNPDYLHNGRDGRDCDWVGGRPGVRCNFNDLEPFYECPETCGNTECETRSPTLAPTIICLDNPDYLHNGKDGRDCDWIGGRPGVRCNFNDLEPFDECPVTCGNC